MNKLLRWILTFRRFIKIANPIAVPYIVSTIGNAVDLKSQSSLYIRIVSANGSIKQIAYLLLDKSRELTSSNYGYEAEIESDNNYLIMHTLQKLLS